MDAQSELRRRSPFHRELWLCGNREPKWLDRYRSLCLRLSAAGTCDVERSARSSGDGALLCRRRHRRLVEGGHLLVRILSGDIDSPPLWRGTRDAHRPPTTARALHLAWRSRDAVAAGVARAIIGTCTDS